MGILIKHGIRLLLLIPGFLFCAPVSIYCQGGAVLKGRVLEKGTREPLIGVTVIEVNEDNRTLNGTVTDVSGNFTAAASGDVLIGWDDVNTGATINPNGTYALPAASFIASAEPNGLRVIASVLQVALQCTMAVDAGGPDGTTPPVPDEASPTPDSALISFPIQ